MLCLPASSSPLRELFDVAELAQAAAPSRRHLLPTLRDAIRASRRSFSDPAVRSVNMVCVFADGSLRLVEFGPRGGRRDLWNFGAL